MGNTNSTATEKSARSPSFSEVNGVVEALDGWEVVGVDSETDTSPDSKRLPKTCPHRKKRHCSLTLDGVSCCKCRDTREWSTTGLYGAYVDGKGCVQTAHRYDHYCPGCKRYEQYQDRSRAREREEHERATEKRRIEELAVLKWKVDKLRRAQRRKAFVHTRCQHWMSRDCSVTSTKGLCCECADTRDVSRNGLYRYYLDGLGDVESVKRWAHYCPGCLAAGEALEERRQKREAVA